MASSPGRESSVFFSSVRFGHFQLTLLAATHVPSSLSPKGNIDNPLKLPAWRWEYKEGGSYSILIEHDGKRILVQGSAGFKADVLKGRHGDVVFLGIGQLRKQDDAYRELTGRRLSLGSIPVVSFQFTVTTFGCRWISHSFRFLVLSTTSKDQWSF